MCFIMMIGDDDGCWLRSERTSVLSKARVRFALPILDQTQLDRSSDCVHIQVWFWTTVRLCTRPRFTLD